MKISKRMLIGTAMTGGVYFIAGELLFRGLLGKIHTPLLVGLYFLGLMIFVIIGIQIIGATMSRLIRPYRDIVLRCVLVCLYWQPAVCWNFCMKYVSVRNSRSRNPIFLPLIIPVP